MLLMLLSLVGVGGAADTQSMTYALSVGDAPVGTREVTVRFLPAEELGGEEARLLTSYTNLDGRAAGLPLDLKVRASAHFADGLVSFSATVARNDARWEVQGRQAPDGSWHVSKRQDGELKKWEYRRSEVDLSSLGLHDPERQALLDGRSSVRLLTVESGQIFTGPLADGGQTELQIGDVSVSAHSRRWSPPEGAMALAWGPDGLLLRSTTVVLGREVVAELTELPPPRSFGTVELAPLGGGSGVAEEEL